MYASRERYIHRIKKVNTKANNYGLNSTKQTLSIKRVDANVIRFFAIHIFAINCLLDKIPLLNAATDNRAFFTLNYSLLKLIMSHINNKY